MHCCPFLFRADGVMWVQEGSTALELARLGPGGVWGDAESAYPAVIELLTNPVAVLVSECTNRKWRREWDKRSEILQKTTRGCVY